MKSVPFQIGPLGARLGWCLPLLALSACQPASVPQVAPPVVWVSQASPASDAAARVFSAVLQPRVESHVGFQVGGRVALRLVETGQQVRAGQTLAQLGTDDLLTGQQSARQQVLGAEAELAQLQSDEARLTRLAVDGSAPAAELERQRTRVRAAQARLEAARQGEQLAANRVSHASLKAPFDGVVTQVLADAGQVLAEGQPMFTLARAGELEAEVFLPEDLADAARRTPASLVWRLPQGPQPAPLALKLREVSPMGVGPGRQVKVRYALEPTSAWRAGMRWGQAAEVHWPASGSATAAAPAPASAAQEATVALPTGALVKRDGQAHVWLVNPTDNRLVRQVVTVHRHTTDGVVVSGLPAGSRVVSAGAQKLVAGTVVTPRERSHTHLAWQADGRGDGAEKAEVAEGRRP